MTKNYDIIIVGGGLAGLTQGILLAQEGFSIACIDAQSLQTQLAKGYDTRTTAISWGSRNVLRKAGIWAAFDNEANAGAKDLGDNIVPIAQSDAPKKTEESAAEHQSCPILDIKILDGDSPFTLSFLSQEVEGRAFGWIVDNRDLREALCNKAAELKNFHHITGQTVTGYDVENDECVSVTLNNGDNLSAKLLLGCDGRNSKTREFMKIGSWGHSYGQSAIVCCVTHENAHNNVAVEHFLPQGPFASLPMMAGADGQHRSSVVWSMDAGAAKSYLQCPDDVFTAHLNRLYQGRFGDVKLASKRAAWPLGINMAYSYIGKRMALMAEAAHGIHPIAGQGLNLSLRDCAALTEILCEARDHGETDWGMPEILRKYQKNRRMDNVMMGIATEGFNGLFSNNMKLPKAFRKIGLRLLDRLPKTKRFFMTQAMGTAGHVPDMVKGGLGKEPPSQTDQSQQQPQSQSQSHLHSKSKSERV